MSNTIQSGRRRAVQYVVLVNKSGSDAAKVAGVGATVEVYLQGATVRSATGSPIANGGSGTIPISSPGMIEVGDSLQNGTSATPSVTVTAVNRVVVGSKLTFTLSVNSDSNGAFAFASDDRLVNKSRRPTLYKDPGDDISYGGSSCISDANGMVRFYCKARSVDLITSGGTPSAPATMVRDVPADDTGLIVNVQDYGGSIKAAVDALRHLSAGTGGEVYIPAGLYILDTADLPISLDFPCVVRGAGKNATQIYVEATAGNEDLDVFRIEESYCGIEGLTIKGRATSGTGRGIVIADQGGSTKEFCFVRNVQVLDMSSYAIDIGAVSGGMGAFDLVEVSHSEFAGSETNAQARTGLANTMVTFSNCRFKADSPTGQVSPTGVECVHIDSGANVLFQNCDGRPPDLSTNAVTTNYSSGAYSNPKDGAANVVIDCCDWEYSAAPTTETVPLIYLQGVSCAIVRDTILYQFGSGVHFEDCYAPRIQGCVLKALGGSGYHVKFTDCFYPQEVGNVYEYVDAAPHLGKRVAPTISTGGANPGLSSYSAGLRIPVYATDTERDTAPGAGTDDKRASAVAGTMIYVVTPTSPTSHLQIYHGGAWVGIGNQAGGAI